MNDNEVVCKAVFIVYDQAHQPNIEKALKNINLKGYTSWQDIQGQGTATGVPHLGSHAWPSLNNAILVITPLEKVSLLMSELRNINQKYPEQGLRAFVWHIEDQL